MFCIYLVSDRAHSFKEKVEHPFNKTMDSKAGCFIDKLFLRLLILL